MCNIVSNCFLADSAATEDKKFAFEMVLYDQVVKADSKWNLKGRNITLYISKKDQEQEEWWPRLTKDKTKNQKITIDWSRWIDQDASDEEKKDDMGYDPSQLQNMMGGGAGMPGMPGMGGMGGMPGMGGPGGPGGMDMAKLMEQMGGMGGMGGMPGMEGMGGPPMGGAMGEDSDDEEEESQVEPHLPGQAPASNLDDLDGEQTTE